LPKEIHVIRVIRLFLVWTAVALTATLSVAACAQSRPEALTDIAEPITDPGWMRFRANANVDPATFFDRYSRLLELSPDTRMRLVSTSPDAGGETHYRFQQYFRDVEVEGAEYIIHARDRRAVSANGVLEHRFQPATTQPGVTEAQALAVVQSYMETSTFLPSDNLVAAVESPATQTPAPFQLRGVLVFTDDPNAPSQRLLAWRFNAYVQPLGRSRRVYVNASTPAVIKALPLVPECFSTTGPTSFRGTQPFNTGRRNVPATGDRFVLLDDCHMNQLHELSFNNTSGTSKEIFTSDNNWFTQDRGIVTSFWALGIVYDYFDLVLNRKSYDGKNSNMVIVNSPTEPNARGGGGTITIGVSAAGTSTDDYNTTDIVGHEFTHSVIETSANLGYDATKESAALNESFSDIFGEMAEAWEESQTNPDWIVGADKGCTGGLTCRNMQNPKAYSQPDTYQGLFWQTSNIDPHTNGTVQNRWYALLVQGGSGTNTELGTQYNVSGIGLQKATRIAYRTLTRYLTSKSGYRDARNGSIEAARDLFGPGSPEEGEVTKAWCAVNLCPYDVPKQPDRFDRPGGNPNPASPNNNNSLAGATPGSAAVIWKTRMPRLVTLVEDLSIYPAGDTDFFRIQPPEASGPSGRCFSQGLAFTFPADVDVRAYQDGKMIKFEHQTRVFQVTLAQTMGDFVLQVSSPFPGQILTYTLSAAFYLHYRQDCFQPGPNTTLDDIRNCPMCDAQILSGIDRVILEAAYRRRDRVAPGEYYFSFQGGRLSVPVTVRAGNDLKVTLVDAAGREITSASRARNANGVNVTATVPRGVYALRFSGYGNGTELEVEAPALR